MQNSTRMSVSVVALDEMVIVDVVVLNVDEEEPEGVGDGC